jgi:mitogen-activated protein kinase kinase kinase
MTELRNKRDKSDTASTLNPDDITAEVESRHGTMAVSWDSLDGASRRKATTSSSKLSVEVSVEEEEVYEGHTLPVNADEEPGKAVTSAGR